MSNMSNPISKKDDKPTPIDLSDRSFEDTVTKIRLYYGALRGHFYPPEEDPFKRGESVKKGTRGPLEYFSINVPDEMFKRYKGLDNYVNEGIPNARSTYARERVLKQLHQQETLLANHVSADASNELKSALGQRLKSAGYPHGEVLTSVTDPTSEHCTLVRTKQRRLRLNPSDYRKDTTIPHCGGFDSYDPRSRLPSPSE